MNQKNLFAVVFVGALVLSVFAEDPNRVTFGQWRVGIGAAFNAGVSADLRSRQLPAPQMYSIPVGSTKQDALDRAAARVFDGGGYIANDGRLGDELGESTENWKLPTSAYKGNGHFDLVNSYEEVIGSSFANDYRDGSDSKMQFGISLDFARELWIHDEEEEHRWGVDFVAAFSYFFRRDLYKANGTYTRTDTVMDGKVVTPVDDRNAMGEYDPAAVGYSGESPTDYPIGGMYGHGNSSAPYYYSPALMWTAIGGSTPTDGDTRAVSSSYNYRADGDYQELEMLFMLRPWYEITDWWRVFVEAGVGVSWGRFDSTVHYLDKGYDEDFSQWDCYGVAGLGTSFRYDDFTITVDFLGRFLRDDLDVDGRYLNGSIERSDWGFRLMLGYEF